MPSEFLWMLSMAESSGSQSLGVWRTTQSNIKAEILDPSSTMVYSGKRKLLCLLQETLHFSSLKQNKAGKQQKKGDTNIQKKLELYYIFPKYQ